MRLNDHLLILKVVLFLSYEERLFLLLGINLIDAILLFVFCYNLIKVFIVKIIIKIQIMYDINKNNIKILKY
jgi:hypothetical protein